MTESFLALVFVSMNDKISKTHQVLLTQANATERPRRNIRENINKITFFFMVILVPAN